jgi:hypothetical protein
MAKSHAQHVAETCIKKVKKAWGSDARSRLGPTLYEALVSREVVSIVMAQALDCCETAEKKASAAEFMQEVATLAMCLADPDC